MMRKKGQIESIVMTIIFLAITVAVLGVALFTLIGAHGQQLARSVTVLQSTINPIGFAAGFIDQKGLADRSPLEMGIQTVATNQRRVGEDAITQLKAAAGFYKIDIYRLIVRSANQSLARASNVNTFCGNLDSKQVAYCNSNPCKLGSIELPAAKSKCQPDERCCVENYEYTSSGGSYRDLQRPEFAQFKCGSGTTFGICESSCSTGRKVTAGTCGADQVCCVPDLTAVKQAAEMDSVSIPVLYRQTPDAPEGKVGAIDIQISTVPSVTK